MKQRFDDITINTLIGPSSTVAGDLNVSGFTRVDGYVLGSVKTDGLVITSKDSKILGDITCSVITVGGIVQGDIVAKSAVHLLSTAQVQGTLVTQKLQVDLDCKFSGDVFCGKNDEEYSQYLKKLEGKKGKKKLEEEGVKQRGKG